MNKKVRKENILKESDIRKQKTVKVRIWGSMIDAYADECGVVRIWDDVAEHYTVCFSLSRGVCARVRRLTRD